MTKYASGSHDLVGVIGFPVTATVDTNSTVVFNLVGVLDTFTISSASGSTVTINNTVNAASNLVLNTNGGVIEIGTLAGALGNVTATIEGGGALVIGGTDIGVLNNASLAFGPGGGDVVLGTAGTLLNISTATPIANFNSASDVIDDTSLHLAPGASYTISTVSGAVQSIDITSAGHSFSFETVGANLTDGTFSAFSGGPLQLSSDGNGGLDASICFLEGTHIATPTGERPVESLAIGDRVLTARGDVAPIKWMGWQTVCTAFADKLRTMPIRIRAGALGEGLPARDLLVSPQHAMFLDGVLVQAAALVNGTSVVRETQMPRIFHYYHVELADHALILAEGAATETFVDNVDRMAFDNWDEHQRLFGGEAEVAELDLPRAKSARQIPAALRARLDARAAALFPVALAA
jgi:hypothetical protein